MLREAMQSLAFDFAASSQGAIMRLKTRSKRRKDAACRPLALLYGPDPIAECCGENSFTLFERESARLAKRLLRVRTWGAFAKVAGVDFDLLMDEDERGAEIAEAHGRRPNRRSRLDLEEYRGAWYFADCVPDPRQVAHDEIMRRPRLREMMQSLGFDFGVGSPSPASSDYILFESESLVRELRKAIQGS